MGVKKRSNRPTSIVSGESCNAAEKRIMAKLSGWSHDLAGVDETFGYI